MSDQPETDAAQVSAAHLQAQAEAAAAQNAAVQNAAVQNAATQAWHNEREQLHAYWAATQQQQAPTQVQPAQHYQWNGQNWVAPPNMYPPAGQPTPGQSSWYAAPASTAPPGGTAIPDSTAIPSGTAIPSNTAIPTGVAPHLAAHPSAMPEVGDPPETHVTIHPPGQLKHWLLAGAGVLALVAVLGFFTLRGGGEPEDVEVVGEETEEQIERGETPEELAFDDLEERLGSLEDDENIILDDDNGGYGGNGGGYGRGDGIVIGDGENDGIVIDDDLTADSLIGDDEIGDGRGLVLDQSSGGEAPIVFPPCDTDENAGTDSDASHSDGDSDGDGGGGNDGVNALTVDFPYTDDFSLGSPVSWAPLSGTWGLTGENYEQTDPDSFGNITELGLKPPAEYGASIALSPLGTTIGGGMLIGQPTPGSRNGATVIDLTDDGTFLRWGSYDPDSGEYLYDGGVAVPEDFDPKTSHTMTVRVRADKTSVLLDDEVIAEFGPVAQGQMGLFTSQSAVAFDDLVISDLSISPEGS